MRVAILASVRLSLLIASMLSAGGAAQVPGAMLGNWHSASLDKLFPLIRQECVAMSVSERSVTLNSTPETKKLNGQWTRQFHLAWVTSDGGKCRWSETATEFVPVMEATLVFPIDGGVYDANTGILKVNLQRGKCEGTLCFQADEEALAPTEVELKSVSPRLVQVNRKTNPEMDEIPELEFDRVSDEAASLDEAAIALGNLLKPMDSGDVDAFYEHSITSALRKAKSRASFNEQFSAFASVNGKVSSRSNVDRIHILYAVPISKTRAEYVLFVSSLTTSKVEGSPEYVLLLKEEGAWRIALISR